MHAALIATRHITPPPVIIYGNRFLAITTTMACIVVCKKAFALFKVTYPAGPPVDTQNISQNLTVNALVYIQAQLYKQYHLLVDQSSAIVSANLNSITPIYIYGDNGAATLSAVIAQTLAIATNLNSILQSATVVPAKQFLLTQLQQRIRVALLVFQSLALPINQRQPPQ